MVQSKEISSHIFLTSLITNLVLYCYSVFLLIYRSLLSSGVSYIIYLSLNDLGPPLVDRSSHHLNACPIGHPYRLSVSWGDQDSIVQGSSSYKCGQRISYRAFNVVVVTFSYIFLNSPFVLYIHSTYSYQQNFLECHFG